MATFNGADFLLEQITSILQQASIDLTLLVSDDSSEEIISHTNQNDDTPIKYKNCIIADEENWTCEYPDNKTNAPDIGFSNGNFITFGKLAELNNELGIYDVSSFRWWLMNFGLGGGK